MKTTITLGLALVFATFAGACGTTTAEAGTPAGGSNEVGPAAQIQGVIRAHMAGVRVCYETALRTDPTLTGQLVAEFALGADGRVAATPTTRGMESTPELGRCVAAHLATLAYPAPATAGVHVSYPFVFRP